MKEKRKYEEPVVGCSYFSPTEDVLTTSVETGEYNMGWFADAWD